MQSLIQPPLMAWWMCGGGCTQTVDSTHGPTSEKIGSLWHDLIAFIVLSTILMFLGLVKSCQLVLLITLWFYVMFLLRTSHTEVLTGILIRF